MHTKYLLESLNRKHRRKWKDDIKRTLPKDWECVTWINLAQDTVGICE